MKTFKEFINEGLRDKMIPKKLEGDEKLIYDFKTQKCNC